jgi:hypothetical protein
MKKEATPKLKGLKRKIFNEKEATPKRKGLKRKTSNEKRRQSHKLKIRNR